MTAVALVLSLAIAALGLVGVISPQRLVDVVRRFQSPTGLCVAAALRLVMGATLYVAAPSSRQPAVLLVLGVFVFAAGIATPFFGVDRFRRLLDWWTARGTGFLRAWAAFAFAFGLLLARALVP